VGIPEGPSKITSKLMYDLLVLAWRRGEITAHLDHDVTRGIPAVATYPRQWRARRVSTTAFAPFQRPGRGTWTNSAVINRYHVQMLGYFSGEVGRRQPDGDGTLPGIIRWSSYGSSMKQCQSARPRPVAHRGGRRRLQSAERRPPPWRFAAHTPMSNLIAGRCWTSWESIRTASATATVQTRKSDARLPPGYNVRNPEERSFSPR